MTAYVFHPHFPEWSVAQSLTVALGIFVCMAVVVFGTDWLRGRGR